MSTLCQQFPERSMLNVYELAEPSGSVISQQAGQGLGDHPKAAIGYHLKSGHREVA